MINWLKGKILEKDLRHIVLNVGGVGYKVFVTGETLAEAGTDGSEMALWTHHAVREDSEDLYGFASRESLNMFEHLLSVSGIGPKTALNIMNITSPETIREAVESGETSYLTKVSGIGKKVAEKIVLELRDKFGAYNPKNSGSAKESELAIEALKSLGYSEREAREAIKKLGKDAGSTEELIKKALKNLS